MPGLDSLLPFFAATFVFAIMPGPALLYTAARTMAHGRSGGLMAALGIHIGGFTHVVAAAFGLWALFELVPALYVGLKIAGALYLIYIGIGIIRSRLDPGEVPTTVASRNGRRAFAQSVTVEVLNPKTALFYVAFLPQFVDASAGWEIWLQMLVLGTIVNVAFSLADIAAVFVTSAVLGALRKGRRAMAVVRWMGGSLLVGLGVHLAVSER